MQIFYLQITNFIKNNYHFYDYYILLRFCFKVINESEKS